MRKSPSGATGNMRFVRKSAPTRLLRMTLLVALLAIVTIVPALSITQPSAQLPQELMRATTSSAAFDTINAGWDQVVPYGNKTCVNGSAVFSIRAHNPTLDSRDIRNMLFNWTFEENGVNVSLLGSQPERLWNFIGVYEVTLTATDTRTDEVAIDTLIVRVVVDADAGRDRIFTAGNETASHVELNASLSASNYNITSYHWTWEYRGQQYVNTNVSFFFDFKAPGTYEVFLNVTDEMNNSAEDSVVIRVLHEPTFFTEHWLGLLVGIPALIIIVLWLVTKMRRDHALVTKTDIEKIKLKSKDLRKQWQIYKSNRLGLAGLIILFIFAGMAILAPMISTVSSPNDSSNFEPTLLPGDPMLLPEHFEWVNPMPPTFDPSPYTGIRHILGTDAQGQDVWSMTMYGARASLEVGLIATFISVVLGAVIGLAAGYFGKATDEVLMRVTDFFLVLPWFPLMIVMMAILGQKFIWVVLVIGLTSWPSTARVVRSQVLTVKERQFIVRARCVGSGDSHIIRTHIMPNVLPLIFANTVLLIAVAIFSEAFLDFFGLGDPTVISWGAMLEFAYEAQAFSAGAWWWISAPGVCIVLMVLSFSLVGYAIDDVLNPKLRKR